jgi:transposase
MGVVAVRLRALAACVEQPMETVSSVFGVHTRTIRTWARRYREQRVEGLRDRPKGHNPAKLDQGKRAAIEGWLADGVDARGKPTHWTIAKLVSAVTEEFGITVGKTPLWLTIRGMGFRPRVPRPRHAKADAEAQADFKKNRGNRRRTAKGSRRRRPVSG